MDFAVLGPIAVRRDGRELPLGGPKQRALLAMLLLHANEVVARDRLIDGLWGERPPPSAGHTLDSYVSRLRKALGNGRLERRAPGYALQVEPGELDLQRFEDLLREGRVELARGAAADAAQTLRSALAEWRGSALADVIYEPFAQDEAEQLEERRLNAFEDRVEADLALGAGDELVPELEAAARAHPFRERLLGQLMVALYRAGRQREALDAFQAARQWLVGELGLEPGPGLHELQRKILTHDPSLGWPNTRPHARPRRVGGGPKRAAAAVAAAAIAAGVAVGALLGTGGTSGSPSPRNLSGLVGLSGESGRLSSDVALPGTPAAIAEGNGSVWIADPNAGVVSRFDIARAGLVDRVPVGGNPGAIAVGGGSVWAASVPGDRVQRVDPSTGTVTQTVMLQRARAGALAFGVGRLWVADITNDSLIAIEPKSGKISRTIALSFRPTALAVGDAVIWAANYDGNSVAEVDVATGRTIDTLRVGNGPTALAVGLGAVWVANTLDSTVSRIDPSAGSVAATIAVGSGPDAIAAARRSVWVANQYSASLSRIDPHRNVVVQTARLNSHPTALAVGGGRIWVGVRPAGEHRGGTLVLLHTRPLFIDPGLNVDLFPPVSDGLTRDGLVTYNHAAGPAGIQLVPDLAVNVPLPTDGGTTYTFRLRPGIRYSDGRAVRAADFRRAIERLFRVESDGRPLFVGIEGAGRCDREHCDLSSGIVTDDSTRTVTFHLRAPDPDFLNSLATGGLATPVPAGTPFHRIQWAPIPGTGPYKIASASPQAVRYVRNPFFRERSHAAQPFGNPDVIVMRFGLAPDQEVRAIEHGQADWMADKVPAASLPALKRRFPGQLHSFSIPNTDFFQFNTRLRPFNDSRVRRAFNYALDRRAIVRIYGGHDLASPTCQVLPPGVRGYLRYCPYTKYPDHSGRWTRPDLAHARRLVAASGTRGTRVTVWGWTDDPTISPRVIRYAASMLQRLGYPARVHLVSHASIAHPPPSVFDRIQVIASAWSDTPYGFFAAWFSCGGAINHEWFCNDRVDREIARARALQATRSRASTALWARLDHELVDLAAWAPVINERGIDFVSPRVRNYQVHPYWGLLADQLSVRTAAPRDGEANVHAPTVSAR